MAAGGPAEDLMRSRGRSWCGFLLLLLGGLAACGPKPPVKLGFVGGLTGSVGELGSAGRNGALLAVEMKNASGGIGGRRIELLMRDDKQDPQTAAAVLRELSAAGVVAVVGPMTSVVGKALAPVAGELGLVLVGGTVATPDLSGRDDFFFRVIAPTTVYATQSARLAREALRARAAMVVVDRANAEYTERWAADFKTAFERNGARVVELVSFDSRQPVDFGPIAERAAARRPDLLALAMSARDAGLLGRRVRQALPEVQLFGSGWTASPRLIEMGGVAIAGMWVEQYYDLDSKAAVWQAMDTAYRERFGLPPDYAALAGFDATLVALSALERGATRETFKDKLLAGGEFPGAQVPIRFDAFGDPQRDLYMSRVKNGGFETVSTGP
jgi:branched-chain amino acid transport system substrate-binding protein